MVNKELHFTHPQYARMTRAMLVVHEVYGLTGNYRTLAEELNLLYETGFEVRAVDQIALSNYVKTARMWHDNMGTHRTDLINAAGSEFYKHFRAYLKIVAQLFKGPAMSLDFVAARKLPADTV